jgi:hypothetical protein
MSKLNLSRDSEGRGRSVRGGLSRSVIEEQKRQSDKIRNTENIYIGEHMKRWNRVRESLNLTFNYEVAGFFDRQVHVTVYLSIFSLHFK